MDWKSLQGERLSNIRRWYSENYCKAKDMLPVVNKYMVLWAVFNALYNLAYLPKRKVRDVKEEYGHRIPVIGYKSEKEILRKFAIHLSKQDGLVTDLLTGDQRRCLEEFERRRPDVDQPNQEIYVEVKGKEYTFAVTEFQGIASIDRRVYLEDGSVLYQYAPFDLELDEDGNPADKVKLMKQLIYFLYQLRNNIVHGGSAFIATKKLIDMQALPVLETIVDYVFAHERVIMTAAR